MTAPKVLIIDDEPLLVKATCMALKRKGFTMEGALNGRDGLAAARRLLPDLVLLDIMMPGMDGWEVLSRLQAEEETRDIPVIVFTAKEYSNGPAVAREHGARDFIVKPFDPGELAEVVRKHTGGAQESSKGIHGPAEPA